VTFADLYGDRLDEALGTGDRSGLFTIARRKAAINEAQTWFLTQTSCLSKTWPITLVQATGEYDLEELVTDDTFLFINPKQGPRIEVTDAHGNTTVFSGEEEFPRRTVPWLNEYRDGWQADKPGMPDCWYEREEGAESIIGVTPPPDLNGSTLVLQVPYVYSPQALVQDTDEPFTVAGVTKRSIAPWHDALGFRAAARLELLRKGLDRSEIMQTLAQQRVDEYNARTTVVGPQRLRVPRRPGVGIGKPGRFGPHAPGERFGRTW